MTDGRSSVISRPPKSVSGSIETYFSERPWRDNGEESGAKRSDRIETRRIAPKRGNGNRSKTLSATVRHVCLVEEP